MGMRESGGTWRRGTRIASRPSGWPVLRTPKWMLAAGVVLVAGLTLAAIPHRPSTAQRAADLRGMVHELNIDIESCAGGVNDSITALRAIQSGASNDVKTAVKIANLAAANCSPANSMPMEDLVQYQAPESLASFHLQTVANELVTWGFPLAQRVQTDVATLVAAKTPTAARVTIRRQPSVRPISGSFRGPKTISATAKMSRSSGRPSEPNMR